MSFVELFDKAAIKLRSADFWRADADVIKSVTFVAGDSLAIVSPHDAVISPNAGMRSRSIRWANLSAVSSACSAARIWLRPFRQARNLAPHISRGGFHRAFRIVEISAYADSKPANYRTQASDQNALKSAGQRQETAGAAHWTPSPRPPRTKLAAAGRSHPTAAVIACRSRYPLQATSALAVSVSSVTSTSRSTNSAFSSTGSPSRRPEPWTCIRVCTRRALRWSTC